MLLGLIARIARAVVDKDIKQDAVLYMDMARVWSVQGADASTSLHSMIPPLWPWLLGVGHSIGIEPEVSGQVLGILLGVSVIGSVFVICKTIFKQKAYALVGALLAAIHPYLIRLSTEMLRDTVYIPLVTLALALAMSAAINHKWWKWGLFGFVCALAVMTRREGGEILVFLSCWSLIELIQKRAVFIDALKRVFVAHFMAYGVLLAVALPVQIEMAKTHTTWRIVPWGIEMNLRQLLSISEDELFKKVQEK